jgi:hypothetical protein
MEEKNRLYFIGYEVDQNVAVDDHDAKNHTVLFVTKKAASLYEALIEFEAYKRRSKKNFKIVKILEGTPNLEAPKYL